LRLKKRGCLIPAFCYGGLFREGAGARSLERIAFETFASALPAQVNCAYACAAASQSL
jgi:hypothetical protein